MHPFRTVLEHAIGCQRTPASVDYVWSNGDTPWDSDRLSRVLAVATAQKLGVQLGIRDYRHVAIAVGRVVVGPRFGSGLRKDVTQLRNGQGDGDSSDSGDDEGDGEGEDPLELQAGRTSAIGHTAYAVRADLVRGLSIRSLDTFRSLSYTWHEFLELGITLPVPTSNPALADGKRKLEQVQVGSRSHPHTIDGSASPKSSTDLSPSAKRPTVESTLDRTRTRCGPPAKALEEAARSVLRLRTRDSLVFKSPEQELALTAVAEGATPLLVVLPTGGGKTLLFTAVPLAERYRTAGPLSVTIVILPYRGLIGDMLDRIRKAGLSCHEWLPDADRQQENYRSQAEVVVVSADIVGSSRSTFLTYAALLERQGILRRVVLDECHVIVTADSWRSSLRTVSDIRLLNCQLVLLTATLPPSYEQRLRSDLMLGQLTVIRSATTQRHDVRYSVIRALDRLPFASATCDLVQELVQQRNRDGSDWKGIIYCKGKAECESLAATLNCFCYHADIANRSDVFSHWVQRGGVIVSTSALGTGINVPNVVFSIHVGIPWTMIDFVQETGRVGRSSIEAGKRECVVLVPSTYRNKSGSALRLDRGSVEEHDLDVPALLNNSSAIHAFLSTVSCRRLVMSSFMDGTAVSCSKLMTSTEAVTLCDNCETASGTASGSPSEQTPGPLLWQQRQSRAAELQVQIQRKLDDLSGCCCPHCFAILLSTRPMLDWDRIVDLHGEQTMHTIWNCPVLSQCGGTDALDRFRATIRYTRGTRVCAKCGISQHFCQSVSEPDSEQTVCQWPNVLVPFLAGLAYAAQTSSRPATESLHVLRKTGFQHARASISGQDSFQFALWVGQQYPLPMLPTVYTSNGMATLFNAVADR